MREYAPRSFDHLMGTQGFSTEMLKDHFTLYQGYVANTNKLAATLERLLREGKTNSPEYAELTRRFGWEFNGMRLHELYFENLTGNPKPLDTAAALYKQIPNDFGSFPIWETDFRATGAMRGIGWVVLYWDPVGQRLYNAWINEHDEGQFAGCAPLLVMDVFEHAYIRDYGLKRGDYINAFLKSTDWEVVAKRFK